LNAYAGVLFGNCAFSVSQIFSTFQITAVVSSAARRQAVHVALSRNVCTPSPTLNPRYHFSRRQRYLAIEFCRQQWNVLRRLCKV